MSDENPRPLADEEWMPVTVNHFSVAFLAAELDKSRSFSMSSEERALVSEPDLRNSVDNDRRWQLLWQRRGALLQRLPDS